MRICQQRSRRSAETIDGNLVPRKRPSRARIDDCHGDARKIPSPPLFRSHGGCRGTAAPLPRVLIGAEEKHFVLHNRPANGSAPNALPELCLANPGLGGAIPIVRPTIGVQRFIAEELEKTPVKFIRAGLHRCDDNGAGHISELSRRVVGLDFEFRNRVDVRMVSDAIVNGFIDGNTIEQEAVALFAVSQRETVLRSRSR